MRNFTCVHDIGDLKIALEKAKQVKENPFADQQLGKNKTLLMIFFNSARLVACLATIFALLISLAFNDSFAMFYF